jgi:hypothetical protein
MRRIIQKVVQNLQISQNYLELFVLFMRSIEVAVVWGFFSGRSGFPHVIFFSLDTISVRWFLAILKNKLTSHQQTKTKKKSDQDLEPHHLWLLGSIPNLLFVLKLFIWLVFIHNMSMWSDRIWTKELFPVPVWATDTTIKSWSILWQTHNFGKTEKHFKRSKSISTTTVYW